MPEVRIEVGVDAAAVERAINRVKDALTPPSLTESVGEGAGEFVDSVRQAAPVLTGALRESVGKTPDGGAAWLVGPDTDAIPYAVIQNFGGDIFPRDAQALRFEIGGQVIFAQHVHIPGSHYMDRGFEQGLEPALRAVMAAIDRKIDTT